MGIRATYSPEDNKLRLYPDTKLPRELYDRVRAAGFTWAAKQELFVAPAWTPQREDLAVELAGEVEDEDTSLVDRAGERADRFDGYGDNRRAEAHAVKATVDAIAERFADGQPILVGHHSERKARKDKERIERGMTKAVRLWDTAKYWTDRAAGALAHAKYKELPAVRARRIKTLEADRRKVDRDRVEATAFLRLWRAKPVTWERARAITNREHISQCFPLADYPRTPPASQYEGPMPLWSALGDTPEEAIVTPQRARAIACRVHVRTLRRCRRWLSHLDNRLAYERAMLAESGGTVADRSKPEKGGAVRCWASPGYYGAGQGWSYVQKVNKVSVTVLDNWGNGGANFTRTIPFDKLTAVLSAAEVAAARAAGPGVFAETADGRGFFLAKTTPAPAPAKVSAPDPDEAGFEKLREAAAAGVQVVTAPTLYPTPEHVAERVVELADVGPGMAVLEPSAGTGRLLDPLFNADGTDVRNAGGRLVAVELNARLAHTLRTTYAAADVRHGDFLEMNGELGEFDRVVMNPPFDRGADVKHVLHALAKLKPGGRLVSVVADGPRQREKLQPLASAWIELPAGTFAEAGTSVNTAIVVIDRGEGGDL